MMLFESLIFNLLPAAVGIMAVVLVFESCWRKCPPDKLMIVSGAGKMREVIGQMDLKELMRDRESFNAKVFGGSKDDLANLGLELRTFNVQDFSDSQGIIRSMGADQAAEIKKEAELAQIKAAEEVAIRQNQLDLKQADLKKQADKAKAEADMVKATVTAEKQRELYIAQQEAEGIQARAKAEAEATRLKGESEGVAEKAHGEGVAAGIKAQAEAYNGMDNPYLLANRYIDIMPKVAEQVAKPLTAVDSIKMYGSGNAQKLVKETTSIVDQVASGLKDSTGIDLPSLLNGLISNPDIDADSAENSVE